jgi:DNA-binding winged helix-turn-helix (wHTH) protein/pimeloyl-ACP methyl ester carboxylesterase/class 3 adenylate cyclase
MTSAEKRFYEFGPFRLDLEERLLLREGKPVQLTPKAFDTLLALLENSGKVLEKEEMMRQVWPDTFVEEANLAVNISLLRKALGNRADGGHYIETLPRRGYRFAARVREVTEEQPEMIMMERVRTSIVIEEEDDDPPQQLIETYPLLRAAPSEPVIKRPPETRYARSGDVNIAYQVIGDAPLDLVFVMGWVSHLEYFWEELSFAKFLTRLASFSRLILFDKRGTGLSDRVPLNELPTLEQRMDDVRAVMDAVGSERAALVGVSEGGPMCSLFAATYPEKTTALVMLGTYARRLRDTDYPWGPTVEEREKFFEEMQRHWGGPLGIEERAPSMADDPHFREWWSTYLRMGASPGAALALTKMNAEIDIRSILPTIRVPTLVIHREGDMCLKVEEGRYVADRIPGAKFVELDGNDHLPFVGDQDQILDEIEEFLTGVRHHSEYDRVLATVLCGRISGVVAHPAKQSTLHSGDLIERFRSHARKEIELFRGREVENDGTGFLATFDGPARAIRCALAISDASQRLGIRVQSGVHTGECDIVGNRVEGVTVSVSSQVAASADSSEVLVSRTVKDLVAGSGLRFEEKGGYMFGEQLGRWELFSAKR